MAKNNDLQELVDDHARMGMQDAQIRDHLWDPSRNGHGIDPSTPIPTPSKAAQADRAYLIETGRMRNPPKGANVQMIASSDQPAKKSELSDEEVDAIISRMTVKAEVVEDLDWRDSETKFFAMGYRGSGMTLLDRLIHGFGPLLMDLSNRFDVSNFEIFREYSRANTSAGYAQPNSQGVSIFKTLSAQLLPWFSSTQTTKNIQLDSEFAELLLETKTTVGTTDLPSEPFYIDIRERTSGQRTLSGIFCWPTGNTHAYLAVIEWTGQGYEAFVGGFFDQANLDFVMYPSEPEGPFMTTEQIHAIYGKLPQQIKQIAVMGNQYHRTKVAEKTPFATLNVTESTGQVPFTKKARNKEKTHSYFRVVRIETPRDVLARKNGQKSWSLDHIITVNGHLRWQPYGPGNQMRKLIWIDSYEKGEGYRHGPESNPELLVYKDRPAA